MSPQNPKATKKRKVKKSKAKGRATATCGQDNRSSEGESDAGADQQVEQNLAIDDEPGPVKWNSDIELTDSLVSYLRDNQELRQAIIPHGDLRKVDEADDSKDKWFFKLAQHLSGGNPMYEELAKGIDWAKSESEIREYAKLVEERWRHLVDMTKIADEIVGDQLKGINDEKDIEAMDGEVVKSKIENIKAVHPWYFRIRSILPRQPSSSAGPTDTAPVQRIVAASTEEQATEPQDEPSPKTPNDESEPAATMSFNDTPSVTIRFRILYGIVLISPSLLLETIVSSSLTPQQIDSPEEVVREELGMHDDMGQDSAQKGVSGGKREGANTQRVADVTRALKEEMFAPASITAIIVPSSGEIAHQTSPQVEGPVSLDVDSEEERQGRSKQPTSLTLRRSASCPRSTASVNRVQAALESLIAVKVNELLATSTHQARSPVIAMPIDPTTTSAGKGLESSTAERNRCSICDMYETWDASGETSTPCGPCQSPTREPTTTVGANQVESSIPVIPDDSNMRLEQAFEVARPRLDSPVPGNLKAVVLEISSTLQANPPVTTSPTDCEALDRAPRKQPSYSVENGIVLAGPRGSVSHGCGYTGNSVSQEKNGDEKHALSAPSTSEAHKTPHAGSGSDTASKHDATPPEKERVELGITPALELIEGAEWAGSPVAVLTSERVLHFLSVGAPRHGSIEVPPKPTVEEYVRHPGNRSPASHHFMMTSQTCLSSATECMASTDSAAPIPFVSESSDTGAKQPGAPPLINFFGAPQETVRATDQKPELGRPRIIYQEKDFFKRTIRSSVQPQAPRSQVTPPISAPGPNGLSHATAPAFPPRPPPELSTTVHSCQAMEPLGSTMFPMEETPKRISNHHTRTVSTPATTIVVSTPQPTITNLDARPGSVSPSNNEREPPII
ncbi:hypothetical protein FRB94_003326 [Tulasnella sp. JGI-2019a]|nr:hypothetical protein FRB94_003326 [Tulasnella sp. JGI-2019a]